MLGGSWRRKAPTMATNEKEVELHPLDPKRLRDDLGSQRRAANYKLPEYKAYARAGVYCPRCGIERRVLITLLYAYDTDHEGVTIPALADVHCLQCLMTGSALLHNGPSGVTVAMHWPKVAGLATPNTPKGVAFYLDQAAKSQSANANSAAVAMYRAALDHLMFEQGYRGGMLGKRIETLISDVNAGKAPKWAMELNHAYLDVISKLGNGAIHTNDGDVSKQDALDEELLGHLHAVFAELLDVIYEEPARRAARLQKLQSVASNLNKK
jgi:hypothetical protein